MRVKHDEAGDVWLSHLPLAADQTGLGSVRREVFSLLPLGVALPAHSAVHFSRRGTSERKGRHGSSGYRRCMELLDELAHRAVSHGHRPCAWARDYRRRCGRVRVEIPGMRRDWAGLNAEELEDIRDVLMSYLHLTRGGEWD